MQKTELTIKIIIVSIAVVFFSLFAIQFVNSAIEEYYDYRVVLIKDDRITISDIRNMYNKKLVDVTAYSSWETCQRTDCIMASGKKAYIGAIACPRDLDFGTKVVIKGKEYTCEDRTALRYNGRYDIFMGYGFYAYQEAMQFGKQKLEVIIK